jgi:hypothetical protein
MAPPIRRSTRAILTAIVVAACGVAGAITWVLATRVGWLAVAIAGLAILLIAARAALSEGNAVPSYTSGLNATYKAQYERQFGQRRPEERAAERAERVELERLLYIARTIGGAMLLLGLCMFIVHQL